MTEENIIQRLSNKIKELLQLHNQNENAHSALFNTKASTHHSHGQIDKDGIINSDITSVNKILVTDSENKIKTISQLPSGKVTHQDISGKENTSNKSSSITTDTGSTTKYPTVKAIEDYAQPKGSYASSTHNHDGTYIKTGTGTVTSTNIADGTIVNGDIANTTITGGKLVNGTVTATQLASNAVETAKIKDANVTTDKINAKAVTTAKINDGAVTATQLASNAVETAKIKEGAVTNAKIGDSQVNNAKLSNNAVSTEKVSSIGAEKIGYTRRLTTDDDLDALTSTGRYYADSTTMQTITNNVFNIGCIIEVVLWGTDSDIILQRMYRTNNTQSNNTIYYRIRYSDSWYAWQKISIDGHTHSYLPLSGGTLTGAVSSDSNITTSGTIQGATIKKTNGTSSQFLKADGSVDTVVDNLTTDSSTRALSAKQGKWLYDNKLSNNDNSVTTAKINDGAVTNAKVGIIGADKIGTTKTLTADDDLDALKDNGRWVANNAVMTALTDGEFTIASIIEVTKYTTNYVIQRMSRLHNQQANNTQYYRICYNGTWYAWQKISLDGHTHTKSEITNFPTSMTPTSHTHGYINNTGVLIDGDGVAQKKMALVTDANGKITGVERIGGTSDLTISNSAFSLASGGYLKYQWKGDWATVAWAGIKSNTTHSSYVTVATLPHSGTSIQIYQNFNFSDITDAIIFRINNGELQARCITVNQQQYGHITFAHTKNGI